jgi:hypothetical protein
MYQVRIVCAASWVEEGDSLHGGAHGELGVPSGEGGHLHSVCSVGELEARSDRFLASERPSEIHLQLCAVVGRGSQHHGTDGARGTHEKDTRSHFPARWSASQSSEAWRLTRKRQLERTVGDAGG